VLDTPTLVRDVLLLDGSTLRLRAARPEDFDDIKAFYDGLSPESRYLRFHGYAKTDAAARAYADAGGVDRVALIGSQAGRVVAAASYDVLREEGVAEVAFAVAEDFRGRGAATRMLEQLAAVAAQRGIRRFDAWVLAQNRPMLRVFERAGFAIRRRGLGIEYTVSLDIAATDAIQDRIDERDHIGAVASCRPLLAPSSVAVVGDPDGIGGAVLTRIRQSGYRGTVTALGGPGEDDRRLVDLDAPAELVIVASRPEHVATVASDAAVSGAKGLLVLSIDAGGESGQVQEHRERLLEIVRAGGLRLIGPSSLGVLNTDSEVELDATPAAVAVPEGRLAICSQSGAIGVGLLAQAAARGLGVSSFVSLGDRVDVSTNDLLELWEEDPRTAAVMVYVETFGNPDHFSRIAQRVSRRKPLLAVKGRRAPRADRDRARSHTAAALRSDAAVDAMFGQAGVLRFGSGAELFNAAEFFASQPLPLGRRVAVIGNSEGIATLTLDACTGLGLLVEPASAEHPNPLTLGVNDGAAEYAAALSVVLADADVDAVIVTYSGRYGGDPEAVLAAISPVDSSHGKPVIASIVRADGTLPTEPGVPNYLFPDECAGVLARAAARREWLSRPLGERPAFDAVDVGAARAVVAAALARTGPTGGWLASGETEALLRSHSIPIVDSARCATAPEALAAAARVGGAIALKADFVPPADAADIDAVLLGLDGDGAVRAGWIELERRVGLSGRAWTGAIVQPLVGPGADVLVGAVSDPDLGPVMAVGLGGRQAGLGATAAFRPLPETDVEADELIDASRSVTIQLGGFRGGPVLDRIALRELLLRFALLLHECPELVETDLNPVRCMPQGCVVLDLRIRVEDRRPPARVKTW
jgi:acetate---CoA ligase (ADP-forming)